MLDYYGEFAGWTQVVQHYTANGETPPASFQQYFQWACNAHFNPPTWTGVERHHPFYGARLLRQARQLKTDAPPFERVPTDLWNYNAIVRFYTRSGPWQPVATKAIPTNRADYGELAMLAVARDGNGLKWVPQIRADYGAIAKLAVQGHRSKHAASTPGGIAQAKCYKCSLF